MRHKDLQSLWNWSFKAYIKRMYDNNLQNGRELVKELENNGIEAAVIGKITADLGRKLVCEDNQVIDISEPGSDELYKVV